MPFAAEVIISREAFFDLRVMDSGERVAEYA